MPRLYLTYNNKREYYSYTYNNDRPIYLTLNDREIEAYLYKISTTKIANIKEINDDLIEVLSVSGEMIIIDNKKVFKSSDKYDAYIDALGSKIKAFLEEKNIARYREALPQEYEPRVNRNRKKDGKLLVANDSIALEVLFSKNAPYIDISKDNSVSIDKELHL